MGRFRSHSVRAPTPILTSSQKRRTTLSTIVRSMRRQQRKITRKYDQQRHGRAKCLLCSPSRSDRKESKNNYIIFTCRRRFECALALRLPSERSFGGATDNSMVWRSVCAWIAADTREMGFGISIAAQSDRTRLYAHMTFLTSIDHDQVYNNTLCNSILHLIMKKIGIHELIGTRSRWSCIDTSTCVAVYFPFCQSMRCETGIAKINNWNST